MSTGTSPGSTPSRLRLGVVSCSNWEAGYFAAYRDMAERADRLSRDESDTQGAAVRRGIPRAAIDLSLLGDGTEDDADATAGETLGDTIPESRVNLPRNPRA